MPAQRNRSDHPKYIPAVVKAIILAQSAIILLFTVAMYQEYLSNAYLQQYVVDILSSNIIAGAMLSMVTMSVFALGTFMVLGSMSSSRKTSKDWRLMTDSANEAMDMPSMPVLEIVQASSKAPRPGSRTRRRKPSPNAEEIFRSMTTFAESHEE